MREPKLGDQLLFRPKDSSAPDDARNIATIAKVNLDGTVNIGTLSDHGVSENEQNVHIVGRDPERGEAEWPEAGGLLGAVGRFSEGDQTGRISRERLAEMYQRLQKLQSDMRDEEKQKSDYGLPIETVKDEDNNMVTGDDLVESPDGTDESTDNHAIDFEDTGESEPGQEEEVLVSDSSAPRFVPVSEYEKVPDDMDGEIGSVDGPAAGQASEEAET